MNSTEADSRLLSPFWGQEAVRTVAEILPQILPHQVKLRLYAVALLRRDAFWKMWRKMALVPTLCHEKQCHVTLASHPLC